MPFLPHSSLAEHKTRQTQVADTENIIRFRTRGRRQTDTSQNCEEFFPRFTNSETKDLIHIVSKLQDSYHVNSILPVLLSLEDLIKVNAITIGVYDSQSHKIKYKVETKTKEVTPELELHLKTQISLGSLSSVSNQTFIFYAHQDDHFSTFLYFHQESNYLTHNQRHLLNFLLPYFYSSTYRIFRISNEFTELNFTHREQEVLEWIKEGKDNWTIGKILGISERTIKFHTCNIFKKLGVSSRIEAICWYFSFMSSLKSSFFKENKKVKRTVI